jgi:DNA repair protein RecO (recombination protein O)
VKENDKAIFLHRINYSESSLIATFYTLRHGIQKFIFQGGKKKSNALFPLSVSEITYYRRPDSDLGKLTEASPILVLAGITIEPMKSTIAFFLVDVLKQCLKTDQPDPQLFLFLESQIVQLDTCSSNELSLFATNFLIGLSEQLGIEPHLDQTNKKFFHLEEGEFKDLEGNGNLCASGPGVTLIQELLRHTPTQHTDKLTRTEAFETMIHYYRIHIPRFDVQKSLDVIREILYN